MELDVDLKVVASESVSMFGSSFEHDVLAGLSLHHRAIPARWLYDRTGSELFEEITRLPEYYPSRTERAILSAHARHIASLTGYGRDVIEFGSGSSTKTPLILEAVEAAAYVPIDICGEFLMSSVVALSHRFPSMPIHPVVADFTRPLTLPSIRSRGRLGFFPGSTIGNLVAPLAVGLLQTMAATLGEGAQLLIGIDRIKEESVLVPAYDDAQGVTAQFNLNLLRRINRELRGTIPVDAFRHVARWNDAESRIEMHLEAADDVTFVVAGRRFQMRVGDTIHTENSIKYGPRDARLLLRAGGWTPLEEWSDPENKFAVLLAEAKPVRFAP